MIVASILIDVCRDDLGSLRPVRPSGFRNQFMEIASLVQYLDDPQQAEAWLRSLGVEDCQRAHRNLVGMTDSGMTLDLMSVICGQISEHLAKISDPDMALNNLERFVVANRNPLSIGSLFERDKEALPTLLQLFSTSQHLSDLLIRDPESLDLLRVTEGKPVAQQLMIDEICSEVSALQDERAVMAALRRYKDRETLRISYGDIVQQQHVGTVTKQISFLATALCEAAYRSTLRKLIAKRGVPRLSDGREARFVILALGKLGGEELNYSSDIDLIFLSDGEGKTDGTHPTSNSEFFDRLARGIVGLLAEATELGAAYRIDLRLRPQGRQGPAVIGLESALQYYDVSGRTWERQAFVKARAIAGDLSLGNEFLSQLEPWIYRRYLNRADITGIKALKRRIEQRAIREGGNTRDVKTGHGGIRDIEFVIQFLQLLNGGDLQEIRTGNTLQAINRLEQVGCLTMQERTILEENYAFLRKIEHRLQIMFNLQTHTLPSEDNELRKLAIRMGFAGTPHKSALDAFKADFQNKTELNRKILDHLLHSAFRDDPEIEPEVDLVLDPDPSEETINEVLGPYGFREVQDAYKNLMALSTEKIPFLSTRRCRHFLASISPGLLKAISSTPDPDATLVSLSKVSESLGGKGILWELFSFNPPTLRLYVHLCASSPYLSSILTSNPGMIDELMDSLVLDKLPKLKTLQETLSDLCRGAEDIEPILHSFKNSQHLRVGVRDILGKEDVLHTHRALSDIAEVCLNQIAQSEIERLTAKYGQPTIGDGPNQGKPCAFIILAMGKLGGQEPNYHSDLDVVFLYEEEGSTKFQRSLRKDSTSNQHFFSQMGQRIIKVINQLGPFGRLYELDPRLRPTGKSGSLAVPLSEFSRYFSSGQGQLWERQALCKARPVFGSPEAREKTAKEVYAAIVGHPWNDANVNKIREMRFRMEETASKNNLKRGPGGTVDIEFIVQMLQLKHAFKTPDVLAKGTLNALQALSSDNFLSEEDCESLSQSYRFLRTVEAHLRLMNTTARHDFPTDEAELNKLAFLLGCDSTQLRQDCLKHTKENRSCFERLFAVAAG